jgi:hypothetical protein
MPPKKRRNNKKKKNNKKKSKSKNSVPTSDSVFGSTATTRNPTEHSGYVQADADAASSIVKPHW